MTLWNDRLLIGVDNIDAQHKMLVKALCEFMDACASGEEKVRIGETLSFLISYTKVHFKDEEAIQEECGFPELEAHREMHAELIKVIDGIENDYKENGATEELVNTIGETLVDWLIRHISREDMKIAEYINNR